MLDKAGPADIKCLPGIPYILSNPTYYTSLYYQSEASDLQYFLNMQIYIYINQTNKIVDYFLNVRSK